MAGGSEGPKRNTNPLAVLLGFTDLKKSVLYLLVNLYCSVCVLVLFIKCTVGRLAAPPGLLNDVTVTMLACCSRFLHDAQNNNKMGI